MVDARNYNSYLVSQIIKASKGVNRLLDFGAGTGMFAKMLAAKGREIVCVEADRGLLEQLSKDCFKCCSSLSDIEHGSIDFIYSLNVLEHIEDDSATINELFRCLRPGGRMYIYVPAFNILYSAMDRKVGHFRRYRLKDLVSKLSNAGFEIESARYVDSLGFLASLVFKYAGNKKGNLNRTSLILFDRLIFPGSILIDHVLHRVFGKNIAVTVTRPVKAIPELSNSY